MKRREAKGSCREIWTQQGWGAMRLGFTQWCKMLRRHGKDIVLIAHSVEKEANDVLRIRIDMQGGSKEEVYRVSDMMGYMSIGRFLEKVIRARGRGCPRRS